mmetsp:Transcript_92615/g.178639  ORF Transcript_92615/g.178639 Transcript_92615/m.178639 type:complete len:300 (+) Transcript_92615:2267-3166(+)
MSVVTSAYGLSHIFATVALSSSATCMWRRTGIIVWLHAVTGKQRFILRCVHRLIRCSLQNDAAALPHDHNAVEGLYSVQIRLAHNKTCAPPHEWPEQKMLHDVAACGGINRGKRIIQEHNVCILCIGDSGERHARPLASRECNTAASNLHPIAAGERLQIRQQTSSMQGFVVTFIDTWRPEKHIVFECCLAYHRNLIMVCHLFRNLQTCVSKWLQLSEDCLQERALANTNLAHDSHHFSFFDVEVNVLQHRLGVVAAPSKASLDPQRWWKLEPGWLGPQRDPVLFAVLPVTSKGCFFQF